MTKSEFAQVFEQAAVQCFEFAQELVSDQLPRSLRFNLHGGILETLDSGQVKFIGGRILFPEQLSGVEGKQAGQWLWVDGKIPAWINLVVSGYDEDHTFIDVFFNRSKLTSRESQLRYQEWGFPPFHILGPRGAEIGKKICLSPHLSGDKPF